MANNKIFQKWQQARKTVGFPSEITTPSGQTVMGRYVLAESGAATPSHDPLNGFRKSPDFPTDQQGNTINDRDYERDIDARRITRNIARAYDQRALGIVVSTDGIVLSGNGRTMAGILAARDKTDQAYIAHVSQYARQYGFTSEQVASFSHPRVFFEITHTLPYTAETFAMFNAPETKTQSKTEQAVKLGKIVPDETFRRIIMSINTFDTLPDFYGNTKAATEAINELRDCGVINTMQYPEMFDGNTISAHARELLENVLIGKAFAVSPDAVRQITAFKSVRRSIITALAEISSNIALGDYSLENEISQAVALVYQARSSGYGEGDRVSEFARQQVLFSNGSSVCGNNIATAADYRNLTVLLLADMLNHAQATRLKKVLAIYNHQAASAAAGQTDMFSSGVRTKQEILNDVHKLLNNGTKNEVNKAVRESVGQRKAEATRLRETDNAHRVDNPEPDIESMETEGINRQRLMLLFKRFKVDVSDIRETVGLTVTLYEVTPAIGTRFSRIRNLKEEIAIALQAPSVRIIALPTRGTVGIEVSHKEKKILTADEIFNSKEFLTSSMTLPLAIGKTNDNRVFIADLAQMPHLLVAGATGQGKSVGLNVMLHSLLGKLSPDELQLVLIDPKQVEFSIYSQLAQTYLATPVITEPDQAQCALEKLCTLMDERYTLLSTAGARNIDEYNRNVCCRTTATPKLPYVVCIIDEYGDLVLQSGREMERLICRLAQKARAVGIHLIISTQRPSATIVTGNIKANFPVRIAFRTTTGTDSRVILDQVGAEKLTGCGDLLFFAGAETTRVQCAYASLADVNNLCRDITEKYADHPHTFRLPLSETEKARLLIEQYRREQAEEQQRLERAREEARRKEAERRKYQEEHRDEIIARRNAMRKFFYEDKSPYLSVFFQSRSRLPEQSQDKQ